MQKTFLFYDIETSGLNKCFDQILQFAAIRTTLDLKEIERHEFLVRLNPDTIPSPKAVITHRISLKELQQGIPEIEAIKSIHGLMNIPGTISIGYNSLGFDDEFIRFCFHRNLLPAYTHQYANECSRADLYPMAIMYFLYKKGIINWPLNNNKISLRLEHLNAANQLSTGQAHNAMVDVEVTLALAKIFYHDQAMWHYLLNYFNKIIDTERLTKLKTYSIQGVDDVHRIALLVDGQLGLESSFQCPVLYLGYHKHYRNQSLWLRLDKMELASTTLETIAQNTWVIHKKFGETGLLLPMEPRYLSHIKAERLQLVESNKKWLLNNINIFREIIQYHQDYTYPKISNIDAAACLYQQGFLTPEETKLCQIFHAAAPEKKSAIINQFNNPQLRELAIRMMGRSYLNYLTEQQAAEFKEYMQIFNTTHSAVDYRGDKRFTTTEALEEMNQLKCEPLDDEQNNLLHELESYIISNFTSSTQSGY